MCLSHGRLDWCGYEQGACLALVNGVRNIRFPEEESILTIAN